MTKPRSALVSIILAVLAMAGTAPSAGAVSLRPAAELQAAAAVPSPVLDGQACPDVMVIGARGTNEGPDDWHSLPAYAKDPSHGVGATVYSMYSQLEAANPSCRTPGSISGMRRSARRVSPRKSWTRTRCAAQKTCITFSRATR